MGRSGRVRVWGFIPLREMTSLMVNSVKTFELEVLDTFCAKAEGAGTELRVGSSGDGVSSVVLAVEDLVCLSTRKELAGSGGAPVRRGTGDKAQQPYQHHGTRWSEALRGPLEQHWTT